MEDYEKKYKEALEKIREGIQPLPDGAKISGVTRAFLEEVFPELRESEGETIRKEIIEFVDINTLSVDERHDRWIAWLEKQGESYTKKDVDDAYLKGISDAKNELEKQGKQDARYRCLEELLAADDIYQMSVNDTMTNEAKEKAAKALSKLCIGKLLGFEKQGDQKPADKVEPKFHKGEWIVWKNKCYKVNYNGCGYELIDQNGLSTSLEYGTVDTSARLYDVIKDAKDGDVLYSPSHRLIWIYKDSKHYYACINLNCITNHVAINDSIIIPSDVCPADRVQKSILFQKMEEAGYEWNVEKKEPKNIEDEIEIPFGAKDSELQEETYYIPKVFHAEIDDDKVVIKKGEKPAAWSDEDEEMLKWTNGNLTELKEQFGEKYGKVGECNSWLKSLKQRIGWKPSEEQMHAFIQVYVWYSNNFAPSEALTSLYNDLKKL